MARKKRSQRTTLLIFIALIAAGTIYWRAAIYTPESAEAIDGDTNTTAAAESAGNSATTDTPASSDNAGQDTTDQAGPNTDTHVTGSESPADGQATAVVPASGGLSARQVQQINDLSAEALAAKRDGNYIQARTLMTKAYNVTAPALLDDALMDQLFDLADQTLFAPGCQAADPLYECYRMASGEYLVSLQKRCLVPWQGLMILNHIGDARSVRANAIMKLPKGPFHGVVHKSKFTLTLMLDGVPVRQFRVGLGRDRGTPTGVWLVRDRVADPNYTDPVTGDYYQPYSKDPTNPVGRFWIALEGLTGQAEGRTGFGIHGTDDPASIGRNESLGCIRLADGDIDQVYKLLYSDHSQITVLP